jgi:hypothetical protein
MAEPDYDIIMRGMMADVDLDAFVDYCQEATQWHMPDDPALVRYTQALAAVEEYRAYLCRLSETMGGKS